MEMHAIGLEDPWTVKLGVKVGDRMKFVFLYTCRHAEWLCVHFGVPEVLVGLSFGVLYSWWSVNISPCN